MLLDSLKTLLLAELRELYAGEHLLEEALERLKKAAGGQALKELLAGMHEAAAQDPHRIEAIFRSLSESPRGGSAASLKALLREAEDELAGGGDEQILDAAIVASTRRALHWRLAMYGTAAIYAGRLRLAEAEALLLRTLEQVQEHDAALAQLALELRFSGESVP